MEILSRRHPDRARRDRARRTNGASCRGADEAPAAITSARLDHVARHPRKGAQRCGARRRPAARSLCASSRTPGWAPEQALEGMQAGTVDMGLITVFTNAVKVSVVLDLPSFRDVSHWKKAVEGPPGRAIAGRRRGGGADLACPPAGGGTSTAPRPSVGRRLPGSRSARGRRWPGPVLQGRRGHPTPIAWPGRASTGKDGRRRRRRSGPCDAKQYEVRRFAVETHHS